MKSPTYLSIVQPSHLASIIAVVCASSLMAAPATPVAPQPDTVQSVFVQPSSPKEGCDPFFPKSTRPYVLKVDGNGKAPEISTLIIKGGSFSGSRKFVIINNHTFGVGDSGSVITPQGQIYIRCVEINANNVVVESNGQRQTLPFSSSP